jgi:hypothetical protein
VCLKRQSCTLFSLFREVFAGRVRNADAVCGVWLEVSGSFY